MMAALDAVASAIIEGQRAVMGPVAVNLAQRVPGITIDAGGDVSVAGDGITAIEHLVQQYSSVTGKLGVRMCFQAARPVLDRYPDVAIPSFADL